ncbi:MAG: hypothetical protein ACRC9V_14115 [Aeromonas sp.]
MEDFKAWCQETAAVLISGASGADIEVNAGMEWVSACDFVTGVQFRVKPLTIRIGEFEVPEPMSVAPELGTWYFIPSLLNPELVPVSKKWVGCARDKHNLRSGIAHHTEEAADQHRAALVSFTEMKMPDQSLERDPQADEAALADVLRLELLRQCSILQAQCDDITKRCTML